MIEHRRRVKVEMEVERKRRMEEKGKVEGG